MVTPHYVSAVDAHDVVFTFCVVFQCNVYPTCGLRIRSARWLAGGALCVLDGSRTEWTLDRSWGICCHCQLRVPCAAGKFGLMLRLLDVSVFRLRGKERYQFYGLTDWPTELGTNSLIHHTIRSAFIDFTVIIWFHPLNFMYISLALDLDYWFCKRV